MMTMSWRVKLWMINNNRFKKTQSRFSNLRGVFLMVPGKGIEPSLPREHDFESCASTNSATRARLKRT